MFTKKSKKPLKDEKKEKEIKGSKKDIQVEDKKEGEVDDKGLNPKGGKKMSKKQQLVAKFRAMRGIK